MLKDYQHLSTVWVFKTITLIASFLQGKQFEIMYALGGDHLFGQDTEGILAKQPK